MLFAHRRVPAAIRQHVVAAMSADLFVKRDLHCALYGRMARAFGRNLVHSPIKQFVAAGMIQRPSDIFIDH